MTEEQKATLFKVLEANFPKYKGKFTEATNLSEVPGWDSVSHVAMMLDLEDEFGITIAEETYFDLTSVASLIGQIDGA